MVQDRRHQPRVTVYRAEIPGSSEIWEAEYKALADALHFACRDLHEKRRRPIAILEDGVVRYDADAISRACEARGQAHDPRSSA